MGVLSAGSARTIVQPRSVNTGQVASAHDLTRRRPEQSHVDGAASVDAEHNQVSSYLAGHAQDLDVGSPVADARVAPIA